MSLVDFRPAGLAPRLRDPASTIFELRVAALFYLPIIREYSRPAGAPRAGFASRCTPEGTGPWPPPARLCWRIRNRSLSVI